MDEIDNKIIVFIQENGRASYNEIGEAVGLSVSAINERLKKLQTQGVIQGFTAKIDPKAVGLDVLAFIYVQIDKPNLEREFAKRIKKFNEIEECHHVTGEWSYLMKVRTRTIRDLEYLISDKIKSVEGATRTHTVIVLSSPKESGTLVPGK
jgi:Lrp/AsnC family transcriptional regulator, leucine-responsive regulatory protein